LKSHVDSTAFQAVGEQPHRTVSPERDQRSGCGEAVSFLGQSKPGDVIENKLAGDRIVFLRTGRETNGELLELDCFLQPGGQGPPEHIHPHQEERFIVLSGAFTIRIAGTETTLGAGEECAAVLSEFHDADIVTVLPLPVQKS
jgi:mannose-6-phosphate isomerase-like protein (cupin superfamily)